MRRFLGVTCLLHSILTFAQDNEKKEVLAVVQQVFEACEQMTAPC